MMLFGFLLLDLAFFALVPLILLICLYNDKKSFAAFVTLAAIAAAVYFREIPFDLFKSAEFWTTLLTYGIGYTVIGFLFSFIKWKILVNKAAAAFQEFVSRSNLTNEMGAYGVGSNEVNKTKTSITRDWSTAYSYNKWLNILDIKVDVNGDWDVNYKKAALAGYVTAWTFYWPFYAVLTILDDFIRILVEWFVDHFGQVFRNMAKSSFSKVK